MTSIYKPSRFAANRNYKYSGKNTVTISADTSGLDAWLEELEGDIEAAARPAAQAAAEVLYQAVRRNVQAIGGTGLLYAAIYQAYSRDNSGPGKATYHISWRTSDAALDENGQPIRTGQPIAPHGHLVEFGHIARYAQYLGRDGQWHTAVRPSMRGKPRPKRNASQAAKDAYFVLRKGGPVQVAAKPFIRPAAAQFPQAIEAARAKFLELLGAQ